MLSLSSDPLRFYSKSECRLLPNGPGEWKEAWLALPEGLGDWIRLRAWINGREVPVSRIVAEGEVRTLVPWPQSGAGRHQLKVRGQGGVWQKSVELSSETIDRAAFEVLLQDLAQRLPASVALSLHRCGARLPIKPTELEEATLPEEFQRLRHTVLGWPDGMIGLAAILKSIRPAPLVRLAVEPQLRPVERSLRPDLSRLGLMMASHPLNRRGLPHRIIDLRPTDTYDTAENRFIAHFVRLVFRRLRRLSRLASGLRQRDQDLLEEARGVLMKAAGGLPELALLRSLPRPPASQAMLRLAPYRRAIVLWNRLRRSLTATLEDGRLDAESRNLPELYELWATLSVIDGTVKALERANWEIERQELLGETPFGFGIRILPGNRPCLEARSASKRRRLRIVPQATFGPQSKPLRSLSRDMNPDVAIILDDCSARCSAVVFDPKYKRSGLAPNTADIHKMHTYRDAIRDSAGRRIVTYAGIIFPGEDRDYSGEVGAISGIPGKASPVAAVRNVVVTTIRATTGVAREPS